MSSLKKRKTLFSFLTVIIFCIVLVVVWIKFVPVNEIDLVSEGDNMISNLACSYPIRISGNSMLPIYENGQTVTFDKCFDKEDVEIGDVIVYKEDNVMRIVIIRVVSEIGDYQVSNEERPEDLRAVSFSDIIAVGKD